LKPEHLLPTIPATRSDHEHRRSPEVRRLPAKGSGKMAKLARRCPRARRKPSGSTITLHPSIAWVPCRMRSQVNQASLWRHILRAWTSPQAILSHCCRAMVAEEATLGGVTAAQEVWQMVMLEVPPKHSGHGVASYLPLRVPLSVSRRLASSGVIEGATAISKTVRPIPLPSQA
jgi:hypothetical protein